MQFYISFLSRQSFVSVYLWLDQTILHVVIFSPCCLAAIKVCLINKINELFLLSPALLMRSGYCVELSTSSSSCSSMTLHWRRYGVSLAGLRMRVSLCRTPSTRSQSSSQRSSDQGGEDRASSCTRSPSSAQTATPARVRKFTSS